MRKTRTREKRKNRRGSFHASSYTCNIYSDSCISLPVDTVVVVFVDLRLHLLSTRRYRHKSTRVYLAHTRIQSHSRAYIHTTMCRNTNVSHIHKRVRAVLACVLTPRNRAWATKCHTHIVRTPLTPRARGLKRKPRIDPPPPSGAFAKNNPRPTTLLSTQQQSETTRHGKHGVGFCSHVQGSGAGRLKRRQDLHRASLLRRTVLRHLHLNDRWEIRAYWYAPRYTRYPHLPVAVTTFKSCSVTRRCSSGGSSPAGRTPSRRSWPLCGPAPSCHLTASSGPS